MDFDKFQSVLLWNRRWSIGIPDGAPVTNITHCAEDGGVKCCSTYYIGTLILGLRQAQKGPTVKHIDLRYSADPMEAMTDLQLGLYFSLIHPKSIILAWITRFASDTRHWIMISTTIVLGLDSMIVWLITDCGHSVNSFLQHTILWVFIKDRGCVRTGSRTSSSEPMDF